MNDSQTYTHKAVSRFKVSSWDEKLLFDIDGEGVTGGEVYYPRRGAGRADVAYSWTGAMEGTSTLVYLIAYAPGGAPTVGLERFEGSLDGREGSFVLCHVGHQDEGRVREHLEVVPGMGTGGLEGLRGVAELTIAGHSEDGYELVLHYDLG